MSSSPLEDNVDDVHFDSRDATTSSRQTLSQEANDSFVTISSDEPIGSRDDVDSSFVTVDSERHNSFETASETDFGSHVEDKRNLTKREKKKQVSFIISPFIKIRL